MTCIPKTLGLWVVAFAVLLAGAGQAQTVLVETTTLTAMRQAARVYLQAVDFGSGGPLGKPVLLPGRLPSGPLLFDPVGISAVTSSREPGFGGLDFIVAYPMAALSNSSSARVAAQTGQRLIAGTLARDASSNDLLVVGLGTDGTSSETGRGRLDVWRCRQLPAFTFPSTPNSWRLPGDPVAAVTLGDGYRVAVLCEGAGNRDSILHVRDVVRGQVLVEAQPLEDPASEGLGNTPAALAITRDGRYLLVLTFGYPFDDPKGAEASWLHVLDTAEFRIIGKPFELPGTPQDDGSPLHPANDGRCWVATRSPGLGFAFATRVHVTPDGVVKEAEPSFTGMTRPLEIAPAPDTPAVAIGVNRRLEILPEGLPGGVRHAYAAPIRAVVWTADGLFLGEGGRVHRADAATAKPSATVQLQTGIVTGMKPVTLPWIVRCDADGDKLLDLTDPEPPVVSPSLEVPAMLSFQGKAAGLELRAVRIDGPHASNSEWRLEYDQARMPWLRVHPLWGTTPGWFLLGVDPGQYGTPDHVVGAPLTVHMSGTHGLVDAAGSPAAIQIQVIPERGQVRQILWLLSHEATDSPLRHNDDIYGLKALADLLAAPPHCFSHRLGSRAFVEPLATYAVVVLDAEAAARGAITRAALFDYVAAGGALLFLGGHLDEPDVRPLTRWLASSGIHVDSAEQVQGRFPAPHRQGLCRFWDTFRIDDGCVIRVEDPARVLVPGPEPDQAVFLAEPYGNGRIAVLAAATPLQTPVVTRGLHRRFAEDLFDWLGRSGKDLEDLDGDGLSDGLEDRNSDGAAGPGETDRLNPDTDGDGIPDGKEDMNRNATVDEGETSPLNADSDGDGILDGADWSPLPPVETPHVASVRPPGGPVEGNTETLIEGRNFAADSRVWFGSARSATVHVLGATAIQAVTPPCASGPVDVRIENPATGFEGVLPAGFVYRSGNAVRLTVRALATARQQYGGSLSVRLESDAGVNVGRVTLRLDTDPVRAIEWTEVIPGTMAELTDRRLAWKTTADGAVLLDLSAGKQTTASGELVALLWKTAESPGPGASLTVAVRDVQVLAPNGRPLTVSAQPDHLDLFARH